METKILTTTEEDLKLAAALLRDGGTVVFPTETVYGLGANALDGGAVMKIFAAKGRPADNPLIAHISKPEMLELLAAEVPETAKKLMDRFWPGPLTIILKRRPEVPESVTAGLDTVGIRMPSNETARRLIELAGVPVAAPSANLSGKPSPTTVKHVIGDMRGRVDAIIEGGDCAVGVESTVIDLSGSRPRLFRPGGVTYEQLCDVLGEVDCETELKQGETPKSPGLKYKHYAPNAEVKILKGSLDEVKDYIRRDSVGRKAGMLAFDEFQEEFSFLPVVLSLGSRKKPEEAAKNLFRCLREMDEQGVEVVYAPEIPEKGVWRAVRNRLYRAGGNKVIDVCAGAGPKNILFVCTGNTCRSPMAEGYFNALAAERGLDVSAKSAGLCVSGVPVSDHSRIAMEKEGIDISEHRSTELSEALLREADLILTMTEGHKATILSLKPEYGGKVRTLAEYAGETGDVPDPFGGNLDTYLRCRDRIKTLVEKVLEQIR